MLPTSAIAVTYIIEIDKNIRVAWKTSVHITALRPPYINRYKFNNTLLIRLVLHFIIQCCIILKLRLRLKSAIETHGFLVIVFNVEIVIWQQNILLYPLLLKIC